MPRWEMTVSEYRRVVAHLMYWKLGLTKAIEDSGLPQDKRTEIIWALAAAGYEYDEDTDSLSYDGELP